MTNQYPLCVTREVEVRRYPDGTRKFAGICFGDLAVGRRLNSADFTIYHLPSGLALAGARAVFRYEHTAVSAMMALARIKNRWVFDDREEFQALKLAIEAVCLAHGGVEAAPTTLKVLDRFDQGLNGYGDGS